MPSSNSEFFTICENINKLNERHKLTLDEKKVFCNILAQNIISDDLTISELKEILFHSISRCANTFSDSNDIVDFLCAATLMINAPLPRLLNFALGGEEFLASDSAKIVYVKNNFSDSAFVRFSKIFKSPKVSYKSSFEEVCEDVYNGVGDYCILPIENANGGKLFTFYSLIDKYELKIFAICDLYDGASEHSTRYALLSRKNIALEQNSSQSFLEISIISDKGYEPSDILLAAKKCGLKLFRIDTVSVPYDDSKFEFYHVFECTARSAIPFALYLDYKYPQHKNIGYYISL